MKPTERQKIAIDHIVDLIDYWKTTNDILSPSHHTLIEEEVMSIADDLDIEYDEEKITKLEDALMDVLFAIRKI